MYKYLIVCLLLFGCESSHTITLSPERIELKGNKISTEQLIALNAQALLVYSNEQILRAQAQETLRTRVDNTFYLCILSLLILCLGILLGSSLYFFKKK